MVAACPISAKRVDANLVRANAVFIALLTVAFLFTGNSVFVFVLFLDFAARFFRRQKLSIVSVMSQCLLHNLCVAKRMCDEAPKRFALELGLGMTFLMVLFTLLGYDPFAYILGFILFGCAMLEAVFEYCVGCHIYKYIQFFRKIGR